jgi:flavin reductase (DIM6/NTAB) family NADH-FMN oxidoreductase RutF
VCRAFAISGGDKFDGVPWTEGVTGAPLIDGSLATVECTLGEIFEGGDHELVTGHVVALHVGDGGPLLFYRGGFGHFVA